MASQITNNSIIYPNNLFRLTTKKTSKLRIIHPLWWGPKSNGAMRIPLTGGQQSGKCFRFLTSWCWPTCEKDANLEAPPFHANHQHPGNGQLTELTPPLEAIPTPTWDKKQHNDSSNPLSIYKALVCWVTDLEKWSIHLFTSANEIRKLLNLLNSSLPSDAYMCQWFGSAFVQIMACRLIGAKPISRPMLGYVNWPLRKTSVRF